MDTQKMGHTKLLMIYAPVHWKGVKNLLVDRDKLNRELAFCQNFNTLMPNSLKQSFTRIRHYLPQLPY